jgi:CMP-N-acetylneuraminic acid synthetase
LSAALKAKSVDEVYLSTDSKKMKSIARKHGAHVIDWPADAGLSKSGHFRLLR